MLIKKADVENYLAAKRRKRHLPLGSTIGQTSAEHSSTSGEKTVVGSRRSQEPQKASSKLVVPIRSSGGD
jgi:hypothetical protein